MKYFDDKSMPSYLFENESSVWMTSKEAKKHLKITSCELMHRRESSRIPFRRKGNAYEYLIDIAKKI
ncbi:MAG: hypothetical protein B0W54_10365 [Cellvibrio sp. 79]|nr:MAG: hypothetical protein B0W54_10365 [Cellvibrio sp. 79]